MAVEPAKLRRIYRPIREVISVPVTTPSPNFSRENRNPVVFHTGENLRFEKNTKIAAVRSFGLLRFLTYEPADVKYVKDDDGQWVQLVLLVRWKGIFFPYPEFGGVQLIKQREWSIGKLFARFFTGEGVWIRPEDVPKHRFLVGQNIVPYAVSRFAANSFRFQNGFFAPFPAY